jgi:hypothetical protein
VTLRLRFPHQRHLLPSPSNAIDPAFFPSVVFSLLHADRLLSLSSPLRFLFFFRYDAVCLCFTQSLLLCFFAPHSSSVCLSDFFFDPLRFLPPLSVVSAVLRFSQLLLLDLAPDFAVFLPVVAFKQTNFLFEKNNLLMMPVRMKRRKCDKYAECRRGRCKKAAQSEGKTCRRQSAACEGR